MSREAPPPRSLIQLGNALSDGSDYRSLRSAGGSLRSSPFRGGPPERGRENDDEESGSANPLAVKRCSGGDDGFGNRRILKPFDGKLRHHFARHLFDGFHVRFVVVL